MLLIFGWSYLQFSGKHHPKRTAVGLINLVGFVAVVLVVVVAQTLDFDSYAPKKSPERWSSEPLALRS